MNTHSDAIQTKKCEDYFFCQQAKQNKKQRNHTHVTPTQPEKAYLTSAYNSPSVSTSLILKLGIAFMDCTLYNQLALSASSHAKKKLKKANAQNNSLLFWSTRSSS